jgi:CBS domain containing-hemolysin-like protein
VTADLFSWLLIALCATLSFVLSGMEAGVFALSRLRIRQNARAGRASARLLHRWLEAPENFLWTIFVGNTVVNFVVLGALVAHLYNAFPGQRWLAGLLFAVAVFLFYALFDLLPKMLFQKFPNRLCLALARPFRFVHLALRPIVALVEWGSVLLLKWTGGKVFKGQLFGNREEFRQMMQESTQEFTSEERAMINRVLDLQSRTLQAVTTPMASAVTVTAETTLAELFARCRERGLTRFPVWDLRDTHRRIVGLVDVSQVIFRPDLGPERHVGEFIKPAIYLDENVRIEDAWRRMQRAGQMLAIVMREDREVGIVSMQDILSQVFGEVRLG